MLSSGVWLLIDKAMGGGRGCCESFLHNWYFHKERLQLSQYLDPVLGTKLLVLDREKHYCSRGDILNLRASMAEASKSDACA